MVVHAAAQTSADSLRSFLESVARSRLVAESQTRAATRYEAFLTDLDASTLALFENVYEVAATPTPRLSSERQAQLVAKSGSKSTLPDTNNPTYSDFLVSRNFPSGANTFDNTRVGIIDSGFDNGQFSYDSIHPDFKFTFGEQQITVVDGHRTLWPFDEDRDHHGTLVTSIVAGFPSASSGRTENPQNYRYGLGLAPTVRCVVDKIFNCNVPASPLSLDFEMTTLATAPYNVNVINMSFNDPPDTGCAYTANSHDVDTRMRSHNVLAVVAAGNSPEGCSSGNYVRSPATAKNAIAVGSTDSYTLSTWSNPITTNTCAWNGYSPGTQDATRIPDYSAVRQPGNLIKPDLVAPSTRVTGPLARGQAGCASALCNANVASFTSPDVTYGMSAGTSFAAPVVSGAAAVVRRWYKNLLGGNPSPAMTKAMLINGARDLAGARVRNQAYTEGATLGHIFDDPYQGWGMVSFDRLLGALGSYYFVALGTNGTMSARADQVSGTAHLIVDVNGYFE